MKAYIFKSYGGQYGITTDADGKNLPAELSPWTGFKDIEINENDGPRIGASMSGAELLKVLRTDGYVLQAASVEFEEKVGLNNKGGDK